MEKQRYFLAGSPSLGFEERAYKEAGVRRRLLTWAYIEALPKKRQAYAFKFWKKMRAEHPGEVEIMVDSGAFTFCNAENSLDPSDLDEYERFVDKYIDFIKRSKDDIDYYLALDHIWYYDKSIEYYEKMVAAGLDPIPVYHAGEPFFVLDYYAQKTDFIAIACNGITRKRKYEVLNHVFKKYPDKKFHALGIGIDSKLCRDFPFFSSDSATAMKLAAAGGIIVPSKYKALKTLYVKFPKTLKARNKENIISTQDLDGNMIESYNFRKGGNYFNIAKDRRDRVDVFLKDIGTSINSISELDGTMGNTEAVDNRTIVCIKSAQMTYDEFWETNTHRKHHEIAEQKTLF